MDLISHYPYPLLRHGIVKSYPSLHKNSKTEVAIIGAGITGALVGWHLASAGLKVIVVDKRHVGMGSTAASTSLLQYEIDTPLHQLIKYVGEKNAVLSYLLCRKAIYDLKTICEALNADVAFNIKPSFQFASFREHVADLKEEYVVRKKSGITVDWLTESDIKSKYGFVKPAGILSGDGGEVDSYYLTHVLLQHSQKKQLEVYDHTNITGIDYLKSGVTLQTDNGFYIRADKLIIACGYESQNYLPKKIEKLTSTYSVISEPLASQEFWYKNSLIWETTSPYMYVRVTDDHRILVGGKDDPFYNPAKRDAKLNNKAKALEKDFLKLFPSIKFRTDFKWAGTFGSTKDGLPYIGSIDRLPHTFFALGYGGNGITFSVIAAEIIRDIITGKKNMNARIFNFDR